MNRRLSRRAIALFRDMCAGTTLPGLSPEIMLDMTLVGQFSPSRYCSPKLPPWCLGRIQTAYYFVSSGASRKFRTERRCRWNRTTGWCLRWEGWGPELKDGAVKCHFSNTISLYSLLPSFLSAAAKHVGNALALSLESCFLEISILLQLLVAMSEKVTHYTSS